MIYFIADTHFNHENIIKYCDRPFSNAKEMNEYIIQKWNSVVKEDDIVYHLGDVGFGTTEMLKELISRLNGTKILLRGNHDFKRGVNGWKEVGFSEEEQSITQIDDKTFTFDGFADIEDVEKALKVDLPDGDYDTVAGFVISLLGYLPNEDDGKEHCVKYKNLVFTVLNVRDRRIGKIKVDVE